MRSQEYQRYLEEHGPGQWYAERPGEYAMAFCEEAERREEDELWRKE